VANNVPKMRYNRSGFGKGQASTRPYLRPPFVGPDFIVFQTRNLVNFAPVAFDESSL
jgi:hypothetical protein